jgi:hypothetical protein
MTRDKMGIKRKATASATAIVGPSFVRMDVVV